MPGNAVFRPYFCAGGSVYHVPSGKPARCRQRVPGSGTTATCGIASGSLLRIPSVCCAGRAAMGIGHIISWCFCCCLSADRTIFSILILISCLPILLPDVCGFCPMSTLKDMSIQEFDYWHQDRHVNFCSIWNQSQLSQGRDQRRFGAWGGFGVEIEHLPVGRQITLFLHRKVRLSPMLRHTASCSVLEDLRSCMIPLKRCTRGCPAGPGERGHDRISWSPAGR